MTASELVWGVARTGSERNRAALEAFLLPLDTKIAALALSLGVTLVSNNLREFGRVRDLAVESWT